MKKISKIFTVLVFMNLLLIASTYANESPYGANEQEDISHGEVLFGPVLVGDDYTIINPLARLAGNWVQRGAFWYFYQNGRPLTNRWIQDAQGRWFWLHPSGRMATEWFQDVHGRWFFLNPRSGIAGHQSGISEGVMITGWMQRTSHWYFLNPASGRAGHRSGIAEGVMLTDWHNISGNYFFLNPPRGQANHNTGRPEGARFNNGVFTINNVAQQFNVNGIWTGQANTSSITNIRLSNTSWILTSNETFTPTVTTTPANQQGQLQWRSANTSIATVNSVTGQIRGANPGTVDIIATAPSGISATIRVTVDNHWNSNINRVAFWNLWNLNIRSEARTGITPANFNTHMTNAQNQWSSAVGGMNFNVGAAYSQAHILSFGGNRAQMYALAERYGLESRGWAGVAGVPPGTPVGTINVSGNRGVYRINLHFTPHLRAVMLNSTTHTNGFAFSNDEFRMIVLHELGHLMGYNGHSTNNTDVMYSRMPIRPNTVVTTREQRHLRRVYDRFRN